MSLENIGYNSHFAAAFSAYLNKGLHPARIVLEGRSDFRVLSEYGEISAVLTGKFHYASDGGSDFPVIGDWVAANILDESPKRAVICAILPRKSAFSRKEAGPRIKQQLVAANIDTVFITMGLDGDFSLRRVERYLAMAWESGAYPVILLTKTDLCEDVPGSIADVNRVAPSVPVCAVSAKLETGMDQLEPYLTPGQTIAFIGSSGVGKSTLINYLIGEEAQKVNDVRLSDSRGRHTTTNRKILITPSGVLVVDTPGMRELQLWNASDGMSETFSDIEEISDGCRFTDCRHESEPGCAVRRAVDEGILDPKRLENYHKMVKEMKYLELKQESSSEYVERIKWKQIHKEIKHLKKGK